MDRQRQTGMEAARIFISLPFRTDGLEKEHPECLKSFDSRHINRFLSALHQEIAAASEECNDLSVREIVMGNGSASHLAADDLTDIIRRIQKHFRVDPQRTIRLTMTPSGFDFYKLAAVRQMRNADICFELPDLTDEGLREAGYHCTGKQALGVLETCFQNAYRDYAVFLTSKNMEAESAEQVLKKILAAHPKEIILSPDAQPPFVNTAACVLAEEGWVRSGLHWVRDRVLPPSRCTVQIGCGPGAISVFDGMPVRTTTDFDFYCDHADDYEALATHAKET